MGNSVSQNEALENEDVIKNPQLFHENQIIVIDNYLPNKVMAN